MPLRVDSHLTKIRKNHQSYFVIGGDMFRFHFGLPLVTSNENKNKIKLFSFGIARESPKCTLNISPPIGTYKHEESNSLNFCEMSSSIQKYFPQIQ